MGLLNDIRFYLIAALAVLFLIIVAMCSSAYDGSTDGHADSGVKNSDSTTISAENSATAEDESKEEAKVEEVAAEVEAPQVENETVEEVATEEVETNEETATAEVQAVVSDVQETATAQTAEASTAESEEATETATASAESAVASTVEKFELTPLTDTGDVVPDFNNNIGILKSDLGRYGSRLEEAQKAIEKLKEATK